MIGQAEESGGQVERRMRKQEALLMYVDEKGKPSLKGLRDEACWWELVEWRSMMEQAELQLVEVDEWEQRSRKVEQEAWRSLRAGEI